MKKLIIILVCVILAFTSVVYGYNFIYPKSTENIKIEHINSNKYNNKNGLVTIIRIKKGTFNYNVVDKYHKSYDFYVNSNYFNNKPVGEVISNYKTISRRNKGGAFFTSNGAEQKFYFGGHPKVKYSSQTHTIGIIKGKMNQRIFNKFWAKKVLQRLIVGEDRDGNIIIVHSNVNGDLSVKSVCNIAKQVGVYNGLIFDGGASVEVGINMDNIKYNYQSVPSFYRKLFDVPKPSVFIVGIKS